jgi:hypothetical protein
MTSAHFFPRSIANSGTIRDLSFRFEVKAMEALMRQISSAEIVAHSFAIGAPARACASGCVPATTCSTIAGIRRRVAVDIKALCPHNRWALHGTGTATGQVTLTA